MKKKHVIAAAASALVFAAATVPGQAHADPGVDIWTQAWSPEAVSAEVTVQTLDCQHILVTEKRTDRASRFTRVEEAWPAGETMATYPGTQHTVQVLTPVQTGWNVVYGWTYQTPQLDWAQVVWVPSCADDLNPAT